MKVVVGHFVEDVEERLVLGVERRNDRVPVRVHLVSVVSVTDDDATFRLERASSLRDTVRVGDLVAPDPPLAGGQVALRPFRVSDAAAIAESCRDPDIPRFTMMPEAMTIEQARHWVERGLEWWSRGVGRFAVTVPPSDECVGQVGVQFDFVSRRAEAFYWLDRRSRGRGIAAEALNLVTEWAFRDHGIVRVQLVTHLDNDRSQRVAERCGFRREGVLRAWQPVKDQQPDVVMWSRLVDDPAPVNRAS
jgi:[ribosomal protein S5]-alanine N-acetyltransferase